MNQWLNGPGVVVPCSVVVARCGAAALGSASPSVLGMTFDADITTGYVETVLRHCSHAFHYGIAAHMFLCGDAEWSNATMPSAMLSLVKKVVATAQSLSSSGPNALAASAGDQHANVWSGSGDVTVSGGTFDASSSRPGFDPQVIKIEVRPSDALDMCRRVVTPVVANVGPSRIAWIRVSVPDYHGCEISSTFFIPAPVEVMHWEVHRYLRDVERDLLLSRNALTMFVLHISREPQGGGGGGYYTEVVQTLSAQKQRMCAAIPNTPAAKYLLGGDCAEVRRYGGNGDAPTAALSNPSRLNEDWKAAEAELASLRAACLQLNAQNQQLMNDMKHLKQLTSQQQALHQALLERVHGGPRVANFDWNEAPQPLGRPTGGNALLLPPLLEARATHSAAERDARGGKDRLLLQPPPQAHMDHVTASQIDEIAALWTQVQELSDVVNGIQSASLAAASSAAAESTLPPKSIDALKGCLVWRQSESTVLLNILRSVLRSVRQPLPPSVSVASPVGALTVGVSCGADPLTALYRQRLEDMERQMLTMVDFDVGQFVSEFFTDELLRLEHETAGWMSKYLRATAAVANGAASAKRR